MIFNLFGRKKKLDAPWSKYYTEEEMNVKIPNISMYDQVLNSTKMYPNNIAIWYMGRKTTYKKFLKQIDICAKGFKALGIRKGDIVTILLPNVPESLISLYALNKLGAIANMTHPLSAEEEIKETLISTKSKYLIIYDARYGKIKDFIKRTNVKRVIFVSPGDSLNIFKKFLPLLFGFFLLFSSSFSFSSMIFLFFSFDSISIIFIDILNTVKFPTKKDFSICSGLIPISFKLSL